MVYKSLQSLIAQLLTFAISFSISIYLIKAMSIEGFGIYSLLLTILTTVTMVGTLNFQEYIAIKISDSEEKFSIQKFWNVFFVVMSMAAIIVLIAFLDSTKSMIVRISQDSQYLNIYNIIITLILFEIAILTVFRFLMFSKMILQYNYLRLLYVSLWFVSVFIFGVSLEIIFSSKILMNAVIIFLGFYVINKHQYGFLKIKNFKVDFRFVKESFKYGLGTYFATLSFFVLMLTDRFMLSILSSSESVGYYSFANIFFNSIYSLVSSVLFLIALPYINSLHFSNPSKKIDIYNAIIKRVVMYFLPILLFLVLYSESIILLFGKIEYMEVERSFLPLAFSYFFLLLATIPKQEMTLARNLKSLSVIYAVGLLLNITCNIIFIPSMSYMGAILSTLFSNLIILLLLMKKLGAIQYFNISFLQVSKSIFIVLTMLLFFNLWDGYFKIMFHGQIYYLIMSFGLFFCIYVALLWVFDLVIKEDVKYLYSAIKSKQI
jgi:O-antigen/teichoic acid export membrane protein